MADTVGSSGSGPPKKRAHKLIMEDDSSDGEGSNAEVLSIKSSSSESYSDGSLDDNTNASSAAETLDGTSSPDFPQSLSQLTNSSALGTQQEHGSAQPPPPPPLPPSSHQSKKKMRNLSTAPLDSLAATATAQQPSSTATTGPPKLKLTKAFGSSSISTTKAPTAAKETTKATKRVTANATKPLDDMTLEELSIAYSSTEQAKVPAKRKTPAKKNTPAKKKTPAKTKHAPAKEKSPAKKAKSPPQEVQSEKKRNEATAKATGSDATVATAKPVPMPTDSNFSKTKSNNKKAASTVTTNPKPAMTEAVVQVQPESTTTAAPKENPTAAKKVSSSSKATTTAVTDGTKENKPLPVSDKEQASKEVAKKAPSPAPPPKKKKKKMTFQDQVLNHMLFTFKPFTLKTLAEALKTTDTALNYVMLSLTDKNLVIKKDFTSAKGRTKTLYWANHDSKAKEVAAAMASPEEIEATKAELEGLRRQQASLSSALAGLSGQISNEELTSQLAREEVELEALREQVEGAKVRIQAGRAPPKQTKSILGRGPVKSAALLARERCPHRTKMRINAMRVEWKKSKEKCMDFIELLADGMEKKPKEVIKLLEIETDEMMGVKMPPKHVIDS
jgi:DNA-binding transcriptional regulator GbsR (MarR family)